MKYFENNNRTGDSCEMLDSSCQDFRFSMFDVTLFDLSHPDPVPESHVQWAVEALMEAKPERQAKMLDTLAKWQAAAEDKRWAASVVKQVLEEFEQTQFLSSQEIEAEESHNALN